MTEKNDRRNPVVVGVRATKQRSAISALLDDIDEFRSTFEDVAFRLPVELRRAERSAA